ncbi:MAG TPA: PHP domain-containing protein [Solirubrobacteraceae bacterium]|jgi:putative hydrolase|nr:PHP domain-containing protein [Solirubrobacteraceae bacterium]
MSGDQGPGAIRLDEDWQTHSTFSDGAGTIDDNVAAAADRGLRLICLTDHVRHDTPWVAEFAAAVGLVGARSPLTVRCGLEAKILDTAGRLDLPPDHGLADFLLAADHQVPSPDGPRLPKEIGAEIAAGTLDADTAIDWIETATIATMAAHPGVLIAHLFSVLPKIGLTEAAVSDERIARLADAAVRHGAIVEVSERWSCPTLRTMRMMRLAGVHVVASTDSHRPQDIGRYDYCRTVAAGA